MENVVLLIHLLLALSLIAVVLLQRSEGGGLGIGGGGGATTGRPPASPMTKVTWVLAIAFICTSMTLTIFAAQNASGSSVVDRLGTPSAPAAEEETSPLLPQGEELLPPSQGDDAPLVPRAGE